MMKLYVNFPFIFVNSLAIDLVNKLYEADIYVAWLENGNFKKGNFRVLRDILEGLFIKLLKIKKIHKEGDLCFFI